MTPDPKSFSSTSNYFQEPEHFEAALNSAYSRLRVQSGVSNEAFRAIVETRMDAINRQFDVTLPGIEEQPIVEWFATPTNNMFRNQWSDIYSTIAQTNVILGRIEGVEFDDQTQKDRIIGETKFIRSLSYWYAVQMWGSIPLILEEVTSPEVAIPEDGRASTEDVYQQIIDDLRDAVVNLPVEAVNPGRVTKGAASFLLGRTYLLAEDYNNAVMYLEQVEQSGRYSLLQDYHSIFDPANEKNEEIIFALQYEVGISGQPSMGIINAILPWNARTSITGVPVIPYDVGGGTYLPSKELIDTYEEDDQRYEKSIRWWEHEGNAEYPDVAHHGDSIAIINKYLWPEHIDVERNEQAGNDILFRYADVLLSLAEAHWRLGNNTAAVGYVNRVRDRAGLPSLDLANVSNNPLLEGTDLASDPLGRAIFTERTLELFAEGHRMFDLLRFGVAFEVMTAYTDSRKSRESRVQGSYNIQPFELNLPIHPEEMSTSNGALSQTQGWN